MYHLFSKTNIYFENPSFTNENIFLLFDTVHIIKNVRNNWLNKPDKEKTFYIPHFNNQKVLLACFDDIRQLESQDFLKKAFKLNHKSLYPTNTEQ